MKALKRAWKRYNKSNRDFERRATKWRCNDGFHSCNGECIPKSEKCNMKRAIKQGVKGAIKGTAVQMATRPLGHAGSVLAPEIVSRMGQYESRRRHKKGAKKSDYERRAYKQYD